MIVLLLLLLISSIILAAVLLSTLAKASSRTIIGELISSALPSAVLCLCPPLNVIPLSPTIVLNLCGKLLISSINPAGLIDDINSFPQRFKTIVGERGITLSGGQRQRTALGRALLINSPIIVLDDALASVDNKTAARIIDEMSSRSNKTIIMISHQLSVAAATESW